MEVLAEGANWVCYGSSLVPVLPQAPGVLSTPQHLPRYGPDEQAAVVGEFPSYSEVRVQLSRHRTVRCTPAPDPLNIPESLRVTLRGREVVEGDINKK